MAAWREYLTGIAFEPSMIVQNMVTCVAVLVLFAERGQGKRYWVGLGTQFLALFLALVAMNGAWEVLFHRAGSYFASHLLLMAGYVFWLGKLRKRQYLITVILFYAVETTGIVLSSIVSEVLLEEAYRIWGTALRNFVVLLTLAVAAFFRRKGILKFRNLNPVNTIYALLVGTTTAILAMAYSNSRQQYDAPTAQFALLAFSCILLIDFVAYYMNYAVASSQEREKQLVIENYMTQNDRELLCLNQQNLEDMRKIRHDIKNHFAYLEVLLQEGRQEEAMSYFEELQAGILPQLSYIDCGNRVVSAILNLETAKARAQGIILDYRSMVEPELPIRDSDLCALMTNLIDNAMEAMIRQGQTDGTVEVGLRQKGSSLYLCVINPVDGALKPEDLLSLRTTKEDRTLHGYGHKIVEGIAARYDGAVNREIREGRYIVDVVLDMTGTEAEAQSNGAN